MPTYSNPESIYPLQTTDPNSGAFGAGTVPGSFLAGTMMPQRMADYRRAFGNSMQTQELTNQKSSAELEDYKLGAGNRALTRDLQQRRLSTDNQMEPQEAKLRAQKIDADIRAGKYENEARVYAASMQLPEAQRATSIRHLSQIATVLRGTSEMTPPNIQMGLLKQAGIDTTDLEAIRDPAELHAKLQAIKALDPEVFKHLNDMQKETFKETQHTGRTLDEIEGRENVARINADAQRSSAGTAAGAKLQMEQETRAALKRMIQRANPKMSEADAEDMAGVEMFRMKSDPFYKFNAQFQEQARGTGTILNKLQNKPPEDTGPRPIPGTSPQTGLGPRRDITQDEYKKLKKGDKFFFNGKELTKETD